LAASGTIDAMGNWEDTTYLEQADARGVADAIVALVREEGMRQIARPPAREPERLDPMQYAGAMGNLAVAVRVGVGNTWGTSRRPRLSN